jgi:nucleotide-binding universal stress UspA family protein
MPTCAARSGCPFAPSERTTRQLRALSLRPGGQSHGTKDLERSEQLPVLASALNGTVRADTRMMSLNVARPRSTSSTTESHQRRILVCLDRSVGAEACIPHAIALARAFGSAITLVHVMQPSDDPAGMTTCDAIGWEIATQEARNYLKKMEQQVQQTPGQTVDTRLEQGRPATRIVELAAEIDAEVTLLGCCADGGVQAIKLGSTVQQIIYLMRGSVFVVRASKNDAPVGLKHILVPLDGSLRTESALPAAVRLASEFGADLLLAHIVSEPLPTGLLAASENIELARALASRLEASAGRYLDKLKQQISNEVATVRTRVARHPNQRQCLLDMIQQEAIDLIVLSAHGAACDSGSTFGSMTSYLLAHSSASVFALQDLPAAQLTSAPRSSVPPRASYAPGNV